MARALALLRPVEHAALRAEVMPHVDDEHRRLCRLNGDRFRRCLDLDRPAVGA
jgi:hypothetical protein